jgi:AcrR family transcriptional regulator
MGSLVINGLSDIVLSVRPGSALRRQLSTDTLNITNISLRPHRSHGSRRSTRGTGQGDWRMAVSGAAQEEGPSSIGRRRSQARRDPSLGYIEKRDRLLNAAAEVFKEKGLEAASINDIAARLGSDRASVYYYYGSKQEIFLALVRQALEEIVAVAESIASSAQPATVRLQRLVQSLLDAYERHYPFIHLYIQEDMRRVPGDGTTAGAELQALGVRYEEAIGRITHDGVDSGEFRADLDARMVMFAVLGAVNWTHRWFVPGGRLTGAEIGKAFADLFLQGVRGPRKRAAIPRTAKK